MSPLRPYLVGERGPELFVPTSDGGILFNYEQCFECGTCYLVCNEEGALTWTYPEGGHGVVFLCEREGTTGDRVAIKVLSPALARNGQALRALLVEYPASRRHARLHLRLCRRPGRRPVLLAWHDRGWCFGFLHYHGRCRCGCHGYSDQYGQRDCLNE